MKITITKKPVTDRDPTGAAPAVNAAHRNLIPQNIMKPKSTLIAFALCALFLTSSRELAAETDEPLTEKIPSRPFEAKVLKVIAAKDGDAVFRAYIVEWKGQEVVVSDPLAESNFREGDTITVLGMNLPFPQSKRPYRLLHFIVTHSTANKTPEPTSPNPAMFVAHP